MRDAQERQANKPAAPWVGDGSSSGGVEQNWLLAPVMQLVDAFNYWLPAAPAVIESRKRRKREGSLSMHPLFLYQSYECAETHVTDLHIRVARQPLHLVLVLDMNRSIAGQGKLELIQLTIRAMTERLREHDSISLCTWDSGVTSYPTIYLTAEGRRRLFKVVENLHPPRDPETKSSLSRAINIGLERLEELEHKSVGGLATALILMTDGGALPPASPPLSPRKPSPSSPGSSSRKRVGGGSLDLSESAGTARASPPPPPPPPPAKPDMEVVAQVTEALGHAGHDHHHHHLPVHVLEFGGKAQHDTLQEVVKGRGTYGHVGSMDVIASRVEACVRSMLVTSTEDVVLAVEMAPGFGIQSVQAPEWCSIFPNREGCKYSVRLDQLVDDQSLDVLLQVSLPRSSQPGWQTAGRLSLEYHDHRAASSGGSKEVVTATQELKLERLHFGGEDAGAAGREGGAEGGGDQRTLGHGAINSVVAYQQLVFETPRVIGEAYALLDDEEEDQGTGGGAEDAVAMLNEFNDRLLAFERQQQTEECSVFVLQRDVKKALMEMGLEREEERSLSLSHSSRHGSRSSAGGDSRPTSPRPPLSPGQLRRGNSNFYLAAPSTPTAGGGRGGSRSPPLDGPSTPRGSSFRVTGAGSVGEAAQQQHQTEIMSVKTRETSRGTESVVTTPQARATVLKRMASSSVIGTSGSAKLAASSSPQGSSRPNSLRAFLGGLGKSAGGSGGSAPVSPPSSPGGRSPRSPNGRMTTTPTSKGARHFFANQVDVTKVVDQATPK